MPIDPNAVTQFSKTYESQLPAKFQGKATPGNEHVKAVFAQCFDAAGGTTATPSTLKDRFFAKLDESEGKGAGVSGFINKHSVALAKKVFEDLFPPSVAPMVAHVKAGSSPEQTLNDAIGTEFASEVASKRLPGPVYQVKSKDLPRIQQFFAQSAGRSPVSREAEFNKLVDGLDMRPEAKVVVKAAFNKSFSPISRPSTASTQASSRPPTSPIVDVGQGAGVAPVHVHASPTSVVNGLVDDLASKAGVVLRPNQKPLLNAFLNDGDNQKLAPDAFIDKFDNFIDNDADMKKMGGTNLGKLKQAVRNILGLPGKDIGVPGAGHAAGAVPVHVVYPPSSGVVKGRLSLDHNGGSFAVDIADLGGLSAANGVLSQQGLTEFCERVNHHTIDKPYHASPHDFKDIKGERCFRTNHNGAHAARQMRYTEVLLDQIEQNGSDGVNQSPAFKYLSPMGDKSGLISNPAQFKQQVMLASYFIRAGRVNEDGSRVENRATLARSSEIYGAYASQMGLDPETVSLMKIAVKFATVSDATRSDPTYGIRKALEDSGVIGNLDDKTELLTALSQTLQTAHIMDLTRDYGIGSSGKAVNPDNAGGGNIHINKLFVKNSGSAEVRELLNYAVKTQDATGDHGATKGHHGRFSDDFADCSKHGAHCWDKLTRVPFP